jgi:HEAT repeat protein
MSNDETEIVFGEALEALLTEDDVPIHLLYHLSDMSDEDSAAFFGRWPTAADDRRQAIVRHLVDLSELNYVVDFLPVFSYCMDDPNPAVRKASLEGLWDATDLALIEPIINLLKHDPDVQVRAAAAGSLSHFLLMSAWGELKRVPTDVIYQALMEAYRAPGANEIVRRVALETLGSVNSPEVAQLIEEAYESPFRELQLSALFAMGNSADVRWLPIILDEMESPYEDMRQEAARAAGNIGDSQALPRLAELAYDDDSEVAQAAIEALGEIGGDEAHQLLLEMSEDIELEAFGEIIDEAFEESSWNALDLQFGLFYDDVVDEEE